MVFYNLFSLDSLKLTINLLQTLYLSSCSFRCFGNINMAYPFLQVDVSALMSLHGRDTTGMSKAEHSLA